MSEGEQSSVKENSQQEEKEQDTAKSPKAKSPVSKPASAKSVAKTTSKPGSAKSAVGSTRSGSAKSTKSAGGVKNSARSSQKSGQTSKSKKGVSAKKKDDIKVPEAIGLIDGEEELVQHDGAISIFLSAPTQQIFECQADKDVTATRPYKLIKKEDIQKDIFNRAAICDFQPQKKIIEKYPDEELLVIYDADYKFGENFLLCTTVEAKEAYLYPRGKDAAEGDGEDGGEGGTGHASEEEHVIYKYIPPVSKEWISLGSEKEIEEESLIDHRPLISMSVKRMRREFGAPLNFTDRNVGDAKDGFIDCVAYEDKSFDLKRIELDVATQSIPEFHDAAAQTDWKFPRNANTQYEARVYDEEEKENILKSEDCTEFAQNVLPRFDVALQQNEIMDVFYDDWMALADDDGSFGSKADNHLKEFQSFTDLKFSKDKTITCIDWHPTLRGVVAVAVGEKYSFDERVDNAHRIIMTPSLVLIWSFSDPIHPQLILEAPDDILSFKFCPTDPNIICGGCINGQIIMWDISHHSERLKPSRGGKRRDNLNTLPGFDDDNALDTPIIRYCAVSSIEHSHKAPVTDVQWIPDHFELSRMGIPQENKSGQCVQIMSCAIDHPSLDRLKYQSRISKARKKADPKPRSLAQATTDAGAEVENDLELIEFELEMEEKSLSDIDRLDRMAGVVLVWDTRPPKVSQHQQNQEKKGAEDKNPMGIPTTFKHLDLTWKPHIKISLPKSEPGGDHAPIKFSIAEKQGDKSSILNDPDDDTAEKKLPEGGGYSYGAVRQGSGKRTLKSIKTHFYIGSEDGEIIYTDWMPQKDQDSGKIQTPKPDWYHCFHDGPVTTLQRSPFFKDVVLCIGGWTFSIWKEGISSGPILMSAASKKRFTAGHWSPSRPAVFYITKVDGSIDIWDLLDRTHEPSMNQSVSSAPITSVFPYQVTHKQHLLAVGDSHGTLHMLEIPWSLRQATPNEETGVMNYFEREVQRREFVVARWDFREREKMEIEQEKKSKAGIAPNVTLTDEEVEIRMKMEYQAYIEEENTMLRELGLKEDVEEALPPMD